MYSRDKLNFIYNRLTCQRQRVFFTLWSAIVNNRRFCLSYTTHEYISNGWLPLYSLRAPNIGGDAADVRLRELHTIHNVPFVTSTINGNTHICKIHHWKSFKDQITWIYRLDLDPNDIDWDYLLKTWPDWKYNKLSLF